jgi:SWI/SNF-related matrix-associated actin-dependent regulator 1 of chromatin subfamily A
MRRAAAPDADALCLAHPRLGALLPPLRAVCDAAASGQGVAARAAMLHGCAVAESLYTAPDATNAAPLVLVWWLQAASTLFSAAAPRLEPDDSAEDALAMRRASQEAAEAWTANTQRTLEPSRRAAELLRRRAVSGAFALRHEESAWAALLAQTDSAPPLRGCAAMLLLETHRALRLWPRALFDGGREGQALLISAADVLQRVRPDEREIVVARCDATGRVVVADAAFRAHAAAVAARALAALPAELRGGAAGEAALQRWAPEAADDEGAAAEAASEAARRLGPQHVARAAAAARCALPSCSQAEPFAGAFARCGSCLRACYCCREHRVEDTKRHSKDDCTPAAKVDAAAAAVRKTRYDATADAPKGKARSSIITGLR